MKTMIIDVRPTGSITIANYIGDIKEFVEKQNKYTPLSTLLCKLQLKD